MDPEYRVYYSGRVRDALKVLTARAKRRGLAGGLLDALKELDYRLRIYPQFGQPLRDLILQPGKMWIGVVPPLVVRYFLDEDQRLVIVPVPLALLPNSGLEP